MKSLPVCVSILFALATEICAQDGGDLALLQPAHSALWRQCGPGGMRIENGIGTTWTPAGKNVYYGVAWYSGREFGDFVLKGEFHAPRPEFNSGLRLRFPKPGNDPKFVSDEGYEISILGAGGHVGEADMRTGAIAHIKAPIAEVALKGPGGWNDLEITATGQRYLVKINGQLVNDFTGNRRLSGYIGIENHKLGSVQWRNLIVRDVGGADSPPVVSQISSGPANLRDALLRHRWSWTHKNVIREVQVPKEVNFLANGEAKTSLGETWYWSQEGSHDVRIKFEPHVVGIVLSTDPAWQVMNWVSAKQAIVATRIVPAPAPETVMTAADLPRTEVLKQQGPNATEWALAPLDQPSPPDIRQNLVYLREDLLDEQRKAPAARARAFELGSSYCDKLLVALDQRELARVNAGYAAAQANADKRVSSQALEARRNYQMSWPQFQREESQRAALREQQEGAADLKKERVKVEWAERAARMRTYLDSLYSQFREALR